jgi:outer membrane protein
MEFFPKLRYLLLIIALLAARQELLARGEPELSLPPLFDAVVIESSPIEELGVVPGETLQDAWAIALSVDPEIEASRWQSSAAQKGLRAARAERYPSVSVNSSYSVFDNPLTINAPIPALPPILPTPATASVTANQREFLLGGVRVTQPLYTFGRIGSAIDSAGAEVSAAVSDSQRTKLDVKLQVAAAYIGVLQAKQLLNVADSGVETLKDHERSVKNQVDEGVGIRANLLAVQVALANNLQFRLQMQNLVAVSEAAYNRALQRPLSAPVHIQDMTTPSHGYDLDSAIAQALGQRPEIRFLSAKAQALRKLGDSVEAGKYPQIVLDGGFSYIENKFLDNETFNNVAVLAEWNVFDSGRKRHRTAQLKQTAEALLRKRMNVESVIALQVKKAWHDLDSAQQQVVVNQSALESADENLRVSEDRYQDGVGTNTEVLDAQTLRTQIYSNYYRSIYASVLAEMQLRRAIGSL